MEGPPFNRWLGIEIVRREAGQAEATLDLEPRHLNRRGVAHGGVVAALLDSALGAAVVSSIPSEWWCATVSLATSFIGGAGEGRLLASGRVVRRGRRVAFAEGEVRTAGGTIVATAQGTWHLWPGRPDPPRSAGRALAVRGTDERLRPGKILAVGRNWADHVAEMGAPSDRPPVFFLKPASALVPGGGRVAVPVDRGALHHEVEMVAVIGRTSRGVSADRALEHVLGFAVGLDLTLREVQAEAKRRGEPWSLAKGFDGSAPVSVVTPRAEVGDGSGLELTLEVNGVVRQRGNTSDMLWPVAALVAELSRWMTLEPGDLVFTGTPAGVGPVVPGDRLLARLDRVGTLEVTLEAESVRG